MGLSVVNRLQDGYRRVSDFFGREIWERRLHELPRKRALRYRAARIAQRAFNSLVLDDALHVRAAALTYYTVLSLVPLLAFAFALLKGFGAYELLVDDTIRPYLQQFLAGNHGLRDAFEKIMGFVEQTGVTSLGIFGLLALLYAATRLLRNIEIALNELWGVTNGRTALKQLRDYVAMIVVTPILLMAAAAVATAGQATRMLRSAGESLGVSALLDQVISVLGPLGILFVGFGLLYMVMPHTQVRASSAALGAAIAAVVWYLVLIAHVSFQIGVARFNALYAGFAAIPIFLAWLQVSWLVVLLGAQVAATHQNAKRLAQRRRLTSTDQALRESVCIAVMLRISGSFLADEPSEDVAQLANELDVDEAWMKELLGTLVDAKLLLRTEPVDNPRYVLARPAERICLKDVLDALRKSPSDTRTAEPATLGALAVELWDELDDAVRASSANRTLRDLVEQQAARSKSRSE